MCWVKFTQSAMRDCNLQNVCIVQCVECNLQCEINKVQYAWNEMWRVQWCTGCNFQSECADCRMFHVLLDCSTCKLQKI